MDSLKIPIILLLLMVGALGYFLLGPGSGKKPLPGPKPGTPTSTDPQPAVLDEPTAVVAANKALAADDFSAVIQTLTPHQTSSSHRVQALLGYGYAGLKDFPAAAQAFEKALADYRDPAYGYSLAYLSEHLGEMELAQNLYRDLLKAKLDKNIRLKVFLGLARCSLFTNSTKEAVSAYQQAILLDPTVEEPFVGLLKLMKQAGSMKGIETIRDKGDLFHSKSFNYVFWLAQVLYDNGKFDEALKLFRTATELNPDNSSPFYYIYRILARGNKHEEAMAELERFYAINQFLPYIFFQAALDAKQASRLDLAFKFIRTAITMDRSLLGRDDQGTLYAVEQFLNKNGRPEEKTFMKAFNAFINSDFHGAHRAISPIAPQVTDPRLRDDIKRLLRECEKHFRTERAYSDYQARLAAEQRRVMDSLRSAMAQRRQTLEESPTDEIKQQAMGNPTDARLQYETALKLARMGDIEGAKTFLGETLRINPDIHEAYYSLGKLAQAQGDLNEARRHLQEAIRRNPSSSQALSLSAQLSLDLGDADRAREEALGAIRSNPNNGEARLVMATIYQSQGDLQKAKLEIDLGLAVERDPERRNQFTALKNQLRR
jgi:tetratricopeptide (TPR) repeat protein